jgi:hypothetical protein
MRPRLGVVVAAGGLLGLVLGGGLVWRAHSSGAPVPGRPGVLTGSVPLCYGPGLDLNLTPALTVVATQHGTTKAAVTVHATSAGHSYRLVLPAGTYDVRAGSWPARQVEVRPGSTTVADLPSGSCLSVVRGVVSAWGGPLIPGPNGTSVPAGHGPIAGQVVSLVDGAGHVVASTKTDRQGHYTLSAAPGRYRVVGDVCDQAVHVVSLEQGTTTSLDMSCQMR